MGDKPYNTALLKAAKSIIRDNRKRENKAIRAQQWSNAITGIGGAVTDITKAWTARKQYDEQQAAASTLGTQLGLDPTVSKQLSPASLAELLVRQKQSQTITATDQADIDLKKAQATYWSGRNTAGGSGADEMIDVPTEWQKYTGGQARIPKTGYDNLLTLANPKAPPPDKVLDPATLRARAEAFAELGQAPDIERGMVMARAGMEPKIPTGGSDGRMLGDPKKRAEALAYVAKMLGREVPEGIDLSALESGESTAFVNAASGMSKGENSRLIERARAATRAALQSQKLTADQRNMLADALFSIEKEAVGGYLKSPEQASATIDEIYKRLGMTEKIPNATIDLDAIFGKSNMPSAGGGGAVADPKVAPDNFSLSKFLNDAQIEAYNKLPSESRPIKRRQLEEAGYDVSGLQ